MCGGVCGQYSSCVGAARVRSFAGGGPRSLRADPVSWRPSPGRPGPLAAASSTVPGRASGGGALGGLAAARLVLVLGVVGLVLLAQTFCFLYEGFLALVVQQPDTHQTRAVY